MDESVRAAGGKLGEFAIQGGRERPMAEVFRDIVGNVQEMVRSEVRLARAEVKEEASRAAAAGKLLAIGGVLGLFAAGFLLVCVAQLLMLFMPAWAATLAVGLVLGVVGIILINRGRAQIRIPSPDKAIQSVKENVEWMKDQTKL